MLKKILFACCFSLWIPWASGQAIEFNNGSLASARACADSLHRLVFVDLYADWCGPCKAMEKSVFTVPEVAAYFNEHFVNSRVTIDNPETEKLARSYQVGEFPTYLFVNASGELVHKITGFHSAPKLLAEARKAERKLEDFVPMAQLNTRYVSGERGADFLYEYLNRKYETEGPQPQLLEDFLLKVPDSELNTEKVLSLISEHVSGIDSRGFQVLSASLDRFPMLTENQQQAVLRGLGNSKRLSFMKAVRAKDEHLLESLINAVHYTAYSFDAAVAEERQFRYDFARLTGNLRHFRIIANEEANRILQMTPEEHESLNRKMKEEFEQMAKQKGVSSSSGNYKMMAESLVNGSQKSAALQLNEFAEGFLHMASDSNDFKNALKWSATAIKLAESPAHWKTYSLLLQKAGRNSDARKAMRKAIRLARSLDESTEEYKNLLRSI